MNKDHIMKNIRTAAMAAAVTVAAACIAAPAPTPAPAQVRAADPLATPARMSPKAPHALMLGAAQAGPRLVAVGERGIIIYSDLGGNGWSQAASPVGVTLTAVHFADAERGYAVGHDGAILATRDGGRQWKKVLDGVVINALMLADAKRAVANATPDNADQVSNALADIEAALKFGPSRPLLSVWFRNPGTGWAVGAYGQIVRTTDAGAHWESLAARVPNPDGLHFNSIAPGMDGSLLMAGEGGRVYRSTDSGSSWRAFDTGYKGQLYGVLEPVAGTLLAYGFGGRVLRSEDGGAHWQEQPQLGRKALVGGAVLSDGAMLLAARDGAIYRSTDVGRTFAVLQAGRGQEIASMTLLGQAPVLSGVGGVYRIQGLEVRKPGQE
jgi:photosystem II stability/assembly factor-like uncharacterized protein